MVCYAADNQTYERIKNRISKGLQEIPNIELVETNELGKIKRLIPWELQILESEVCGI